MMSKIMRIGAVKRALSILSNHTSIAFFGRKDVSLFYLVSGYLYSVLKVERLQSALVEL